MDVLPSPKQGNVAIPVYGGKHRLIRFELWLGHERILCGWAKMQIDNPLLIHMDVLSPTNLRYRREDFCHFFVLRKLSPYQPCISKVHEVQYAMSNAIGVQ